MTYAPQSSPAFLLLPAFLLGFSPAPMAPVLGQEPVRLTVDASVAKAPGGQVLGTLLKGTQVVSTRTDRDWAEVSIEGWIVTRSLGQTSREGFDLVVNHSPSENLRQSPDGLVLGRLKTGVLLNKVTTMDQWTRVRRTVWISKRVVGPVVLGAATSGGETARIVKDASLLATIEGPAIGTVTKGVQTRILARSGDWTRIQVEGWVQEGDVALTDSAVLVGVSPAEIRANPGRFAGQVLEWKVQFIALQKADELRPEIKADQAYLLTRGPLPEPGFVYVIVPPSQLDQFRSVAPLQELVIRGVLKSPTTRYLPTPVIELVSLVKEPEE